jgi:hypothetical protein
MLDSWFRVIVGDDANATTQIAAMTDKTNFMMNPAGKVLGNACGCLWD